MKTKNKFLNVGKIFLMLTIGFLASCDSDDDDTTPEPVVVETPPTASFDFTVNTENSLLVDFTSTSELADSYAWDFGDNAGMSDTANPTYTYTAEGTYTVTLTVTNTDGSDASSASVTVTAPVVVPTTIIANGTFDDDSNWTIINHYEAENLNGTVTIADGVAKWEEVSNTDWKHLGIYTSVTLEVGTYQFEMDMTYTEINDIWGEVYYGTTAPVEGSDYGTDHGAILILKAYNAWDCADIKTYDGAATTGGCDGVDNPGQITITEAGDYYLLFRTGGAQYGAEGIVIDNMSLEKL
ncbi:MAG: PKD repeat protein [Cyclobacteriaceae bacterium]|jgi:PKD repeat protein